MSELISQAQRADYEASLSATKDIFLNFKMKNISEGININQAFWLQHRLRAWGFTYGGVNYTIDLDNNAASADLESSCVALMHGQADDMSQPYHWLNQDRLNYLIGLIKTHLGWA